MELRQLRYFLEIAKTGSLNKASQRLNISQPALSRQLQSFERELKCSLFERNARGMILTSEGQRLLSKGEDLLRRSETLHLQIREDDPGIQGTITMGAAPSVGHLFFGGIAQRVADQYPMINMNFNEGHSYDMLAGLEKREIDLAIMIDPDPQRRLEITPLYSERVYLMARPKDSLSKFGGIALSELKRLPLILYPKLTGPRRMIDKATVRARTSLNVKYESNYDGTINDFVARGLAYALVTKSSFLGEKIRFALIPVQDLNFVKTLVSMRDRFRSSDFLAVQDVVKDEIRSFATQPHFDGRNLL